MSDKPKFVYVISFASTAEKVWQALTEADITEQYWFGFASRPAARSGRRSRPRAPEAKTSTKE